MNVLAVASEVFPLVKTGGLADVTGALPGALAAEGIATATLMPGYPSVLVALPDAAVIAEFSDLFGGSARLLRGTAAGLDIIALDAPHFFARPGTPYLDRHGVDWPDNAERFAALGWAAAAIAAGETAMTTPDIVHLHDWQAGLAAAYLHARGAVRPRVVFTIHNLAFQGNFAAEKLGALRVPSYFFTVAGLEFYGAVSFMKAGLVYADRITTVSPGYADEIRTPEGGMGLDGVLRARGGDVVGILNGIDTDVWNPETDALIAAPFGAARLGRRGVNKAALQRRFGLAVDEDAPLIGIVSRLTWQKGVDVVLEALPDLLAAGGQLALLGSGEAQFADAFTAAAAGNPGRVGCMLGYDEHVAHLMQAGADAVLVPSRFEPCGLTQLCALRYGAVPVVSHVGGLADSVIDANEAALARGVATGVQFTPVTRAGLGRAIQRTAHLWRDRPAWKRMQRNGMAMDVSWRAPAAKYAALFRACVGESR
ncbi:MAG TPA: glycogen synthase GlgA [Acetobacteraceae bacterium]|nr:glycogen synthase GlgA [Acetobacteraceae bacterium]